MADFSGYEFDTDWKIESINQQTTAGTTATDVTGQTRDPYIAGSLESTGLSLLPIDVLDFSGLVQDGQDEFFMERIWIKPSTIALGNVISTVTTEVEVYNSFRDTSKSLTAAAANAGPGVSLSDVPTLPAVIAAQAGILFDVVTTSDGPPSIDGTIDLTVSGDGIAIPITGNRVIVLAFEPEAPIRETLEFLTDIIRSVDGREQRIALRKNPRQRLRYVFSLDEDSAARRKLNVRIFGAQAATFGLPVWFERARLTSAASATDTVIQVDTRYADFRAGSIAIVWTDEDTFDALVISSTTDSSITLSSPLENSYPVGTFVMPLRTARTTETIPRSKANVNLEQFTLDFLVTDNDANLADTSAFASFNSKALLEDLNISNGSVEEDFNRRIYVIDSLAGTLSQSSIWNGPGIASRLQWLAKSKQRVWEIRQLLHAFRGSQVTFYVPTFYKDLAPNASLGSGSTEMDIDNIGLVDTIGTTPIAPWDAIWVRLNDGTTIIRGITAISTISSTTERLTIDSGWPSTILISDIDRVSWLRLSRIADDRVTIDHSRVGQARVTIPTIGVQQ